MTAIVKAGESLNLAATTLGEPPKQQSTVLQGRHWSFYVLTAGAVLGAVCGIAAIILNVYAVAVAGAIIFTTNVIGAFFIQRFYTFKELDDFVFQMADKIKQLAFSVTDLKKVNEGFKQTAKVMGDDLKKSEEMWKTGAANLEAKNKQLDETAKKLEDSYKKLQKMEELYLNIQKAIAAFSSHVRDLAKTNTSLNADIATLAQEVQKAFDIASKLAKENQQFDSNNQAYEQMNKKNLEFLKAFEKEILKILSLHGEAEKVVKPIQETTTALTNLSSQIDSSIIKIEQMEKKEKDLWQGTETLDNSIDAIALELQKLAKEKNSK